MRHLIVAALATCGLATFPAHAEILCGVQTHSRYEETRSYFSDVLGACRPDGYCSAIVALKDKTGQAAWLQQLRVARPSAGAPYQVEVAATTPMPAATPTPMRFEIAGRAVAFADLSKLKAIAGNEYRIADQPIADDVVKRLRAGRSMRWTYQSETGPARATFSLRGMSAALDWIDCMGRGAR